MIPIFDLSGVLPPYVGPDPTVPATLSPYDATIVEFIDRFATSGPRRSILMGLLKYRQALNDLGVLAGFQWLSGSFLEDIEKLEGRAPRDLDIVTFMRRPQAVSSDPAWLKFVLENLPIFDPAQVKATHGCHAFPVDLSLAAEGVVPQTSYWFGLLSHRRVTLQWKGFVRVPLFDGQDIVALDHLSQASRT